MNKKNIIRGIIVVSFIVKVAFSFYFANNLYQSKKDVFLVYYNYFSNQVIRNIKY